MPLPGQPERLNERDEGVLGMGRRGDRSQHTDTVGAGGDAGGGPALVDPTECDHRRAMTRKGGDAQGAALVALGARRKDRRPGRVVDAVFGGVGTDVVGVTRVRRDAQAGLLGHRPPSCAWVGSIGHVAAVETTPGDERRAAVHQDAGPRGPDDRSHRSTSRGQGFVVEVLGADHHGDVGRDADALKGGTQRGDHAAPATTAGIVIGENQQARRQHFDDRARAGLSLSTRRQVRVSQSSRSTSGIA
jgi:hypothetical protein